MKRHKLAIMLFAAVNWTATAEVVFDGTFGHRDVRSGLFSILESDGSLSGNGRNLFHSFDTFNVLVGETATFEYSTATVETIIGRVTGTTASTIDGSLVSSADVWIANPNGMLIGTSASFDGGGAFHLQAADTISFDNSDRFRVRDNDTSSLSIANPVSFGFLSAQLDDSLGGVNRDLLQSEAAADVLLAADGVADGSNLFFSFTSLSLYPSQALTLDAEGFTDVIMRVASTENSLINGLLSVISSHGSDLWLINPEGVVVGAGGIFDLSGDLNIGSATSLQLVDESVWPGDDTFGILPIGLATMGFEEPVAILQASIGTTHDIRIVGGNVVKVAGSTIGTRNKNPGVGGTLSITGDSISISNSVLSSDADEDGSAGFVILSARNMELTQTEVTSESTGTGNAGSINILADDLTMSQMTIFAEILNADGGDAGAILITANDISLSASTVATRALSTSGSAGLITLEAQNNLVIDGSQIETATSGAGELAANVRLHAGQDLTIADSTVSAETNGQGIAGDVQLEAQRIDLTNSFILADSNAEATGNAGFIDLTATGTVIATDSQITSSTYGNGDAGNVTVTGQSVQLTNSFVASDALPEVVLLTEAIPLFEQAFETTIDAADVSTFIQTIRPLLEVELAITITASSAVELASRLLQLPESALVPLENRLGVTSLTLLFNTLVDALPGSAAGAVYLNADNAELHSSSLFADSRSALDSPSFIQVSMQGDLLLDSGSVISTTSSGASSAGSILIDLGPGNLILDNSSIVSESLAQGGTSEIGNAGSVSIKAADISLINDARISTDSAASQASEGAVFPGTQLEYGTLSMADSRITSNTSGPAAAGDITLKGGSTTLVRSGVFAENKPGASGSAGNIFIFGDDLDLDGMSVIASRSFSVGAAGFVQVNVSGGLSLKDYSRITSTSLGAGDAGFITIDAAQTAIEGASSINSDTSFVSLLAALDAFNESFDIELAATTNAELVAELNPVLEAVTGIEFSASSLSQLQRQIRALDLQTRQILIDQLQGVAINELDQIVDVDVSSGAAGVITITTDSLIMTNGSISTSSNAAGPDSLRGDILVTASNSLQMTAASQILADTNLGAAAGNISLTAPLFSVDDSQIAAVSNAGASGGAGFISITGTDINLTAATILSDSNAGAANVGAAGEITIMGDTLDMSESTISTESNATSAGLPASIRIEMAQAVDADLSVISADTLGDSAAGDITITAPQIQMSETKLLSGTISGATGDAGSVFLSGTDVTLSGTSVLSDSLESTGNGGFIQIIASAQAILSGSEIITNTDGTGNAGNIFIAGSVIKIDDSEIASAARLPDFVTTTPLTGNAGTVTLNALNAGFSVDLSGGSKVTTSTAGAGVAGDVTINTGGTGLLNIKNSTVSSESTGSADSGELVFNLGSRLLMDQSTLTTNSLSSQGGDISITTAGSEILLTGSQIKASAGSLGNGGNIILETDLFILEHSDVLAEAEDGNGGFINILGRLLEDGTSRSELIVIQDFNSRISADSDAGNSGTVLIEAPNSDIAGSIASQNADTLNVPRLASNRCSTTENRGRLSRKLALTLPPSPGSHLSVYTRIQGPQAQVTPDSVIQSLACVGATR